MLKALDRLDFLRPRHVPCDLTRMWDELRRMLGEADRGEWWAIVLVAQLELILADAVRELEERDPIVRELKAVL